MEEDENYSAPNFPFAVGDDIDIKIGGNDEPSTTSPIVTAKVLKIFQPFTFSSVMIIIPDEPIHGCQEAMILKLFDWRFSQSVRRCQRLPWKTLAGQQYQQFVLDGRAQVFFDRLQAHKDLDDKEWEIWDAAQKEAYMFDYVRKNYYKTECDVYQRIEDLQGTDVPRFISRVTIPTLLDDKSEENKTATPLSSPHSSQSSSAKRFSFRKFLDVPGVLLENVTGFNLDKLANNELQQNWKYIIDDAIRIVDDIGSRNIINKDVRPENFIIRKTPQGRHKAVQIDFAMCSIRDLHHPDWSEKDWRSYKADMNEEGNIGQGMEFIFKKSYVYERTKDSQVLMDEFYPTVTESEDDEDEDEDDEDEGEGEEEGDVNEGGGESKLQDKGREGDEGDEKYHNLVDQLRQQISTMEHSIADVILQCKKECEQIRHEMKQEGCKDLAEDNEKLDHLLRQQEKIRNGVQDMPQEVKQTTTGCFAQKDQKEAKPKKNAIWPKFREACKRPRVKSIRKLSCIF